MIRPLPAAIALALALPSVAGACSARTPPDPRVPSWQATNGFALGAHPATPEQIDGYLLAVARSSSRVRTFLAGRSVDGRPIRYAAVGTAAHLRRLGSIAAEMRGLRALSGQAPRRTARIVASRPAFVWLAADVHGNELSGAEADVRLLAALAAGRTCADLARLRRVVVFLLPVQNPDGRAAGTRFNADGFDLNRDWFARTQPETRARVAALTRFPPAVFADQHEEGGAGFFFPPDADPVHHEVPASALHAIARIVAPRLRRAFTARGLPFTSGAIYDLFFMGYGDSVPSTLFGAAGMTFEKGADAPFRRRIAEQFLAADQTVRAAAAHRRALLQGWAAEWPMARAQGAIGRLQPNRVLQAEDTVRFRVPTARVFGYVFRADAHQADAAALADRLATVGVRVRRLAEPATATGFRGYGEPAAAATALPAGTYYVPMAQPAKHWVQALLGEDPYVPFPYFYDVSGWSNPLLMGLRGGLLTAPLTARTTPVPPGETPAAPAAGTAFEFDGGSEGSVELAFDLLRGGTAVRRLPGGAFAASGPVATVAPLARARRVALRPAVGPAEAGTALRAPRVGMLADVAPATSSSWARWLLRRRYGLAVPWVSGAAIATGGLSGLDALVVPDGESSPSQLSPAALLVLQAWIRGGGTLIGIRSRGLGVARAAGATAVREAQAPSDLRIPGVAIRIALDPADPVAAGEDTEGFAFNEGDPVLAAGGAHVVARYPGADRFFVSGYATGTAALQGTAAATDEALGAGRVVLFAFDPVFRGYVEGTERLLGNALLAPAPAAATARRAAPRPVDPSALALPAPGRDTTVQVAAEDEGALLAAARAAGVPSGFTIDRDLTTVTLRVPNPRDLDPEQRPWTRRLPGALAAAGVVPLLAVI